MSDEFNPYASPQAETVPRQRIDGDPSWFFKPLGSLAKPLKIGLVVHVLASLASGIHSASLAMRLEGMSTYDPQQNGDLEIILATAGAVLVSYIVVVVLWCMWTVRANRNVRVMGAKGLPTTPGWAAGWFFVPIANLWKPYQAMRDLDQASQEPARWPSHAAGGTIGAWWTFWIISNIVGQIALRMQSDTIEGLIATSWVELVSSLVGLVSAFFAYRVISRITSLQEELETAVG